MEFRVWSQPELLSQTAYAAAIGPRILSHYETLFGEAFPLPKMDLVAVPDFAAGAMENWGLVTFRENALLLEEGGEGTSLGGRSWVATVVAHELAHQWFGNLVTMEWWTE